MKRKEALRESYGSIGKRTNLPSASGEKAKKNNRENTTRRHFRKESSVGLTICM